MICHLISKVATIYQKLLVGTQALQILRVKEIFSFILGRAWT